MGKRIRTKILDIVLPFIQETIKKGFNQEQVLNNLSDILTRYYNEEYFLQN